MAIVMEEKKGGGAGIVSVILWLLILVVVGLGSYYIFFKKPDLIPVPQPTSLRDAQRVSQIRLDPDAVLRDLQPPAFQQFVTRVPSSGAGRLNPFLAP